MGEGKRKTGTFPHGKMCGIYRMSVTVTLCERMCAKEPTKKHIYIHKVSRKLPFIVKEWNFITLVKLDVA